MKAVILAGGKGTRLWPLSKENLPKQFLSLGEKSFFSKTLERALLVAEPKDIFISTTKNYYSYVEKELKDTRVPTKNIIVEPVAKNTGPAILFVLRILKEKFNVKEDEIIFVCPSDHYISPKKRFAQFVKKAERIARKGNIVLFGIRPTSPETGYGYIKISQISNLKSQKSKIKSLGYYRVERFLEKPTKKKARKFLEEGNYFWNSGMFIFPLGLMWKEYQKHAPEILKNIDNFEKIKPEPIDKAVIEKSKKTVVVPVDFQWSDVGSWEAFCQIQKKDKLGNVVIGKALFEDIKNSLILSNHRLVACIGLKDLIVVETKEAVLIIPKKRSQEVKKIVEKLKDNN